MGCVQSKKDKKSLAFEENGKVMPENAYSGSHALASTGRSESPENQEGDAYVNQLINDLNL